MGKHTAVPWKLFSGALRPKFPTPILEIGGPDGKPIVAWPGFDGIDRSKRENYANATLIARALWAPHPCEDAECPGERMRWLLVGMAGDFDVTGASGQVKIATLRQLARALLAKIEAP